MNALDSISSTLGETRRGLRVSPTGADFSAFFGEVTAALGLREAGYRRTRGSVRKRVARRLRQLELSDLSEYRRYLDAHAGEWSWLDSCCRITISRFARDRPRFDALVQTYMPECAAAAVARGSRQLSVWSAGCASGEEPYSLALAWSLEEVLGPRFSPLSLDVLATDADPRVLERAARAVYSAATLRELPERFRSLAFERQGSEWILAEPFRASVRFRQADLRRSVPEEDFDLICCRNLAFTYFDEAAQRQTVRWFIERLRPGGILMLGRGESLPVGSEGLVLREPGFYARAGAGKFERP